MVGGGLAASAGQQSGGNDAGARGGFELSGTIGQPDANELVISGGDLEVTGGFWPGVAAPAVMRSTCGR